MYGNDVDVILASKLGLVYSRLFDNKLVDGTVLQFSIILDVARERPQSYSSFQFVTKLRVIITLDQTCKIEFGYNMPSSFSAHCRLLCNAG